MAKRRPKAEFEKKPKLMESGPVQCDTMESGPVQSEPMESAKLESESMMIQWTRTPSLPGPSTIETPKRPRGGCRSNPQQLRANRDPSED
ncbi:hypothetical protein Ddc_11834 [Ditylenchus destructor]|nr:hypothetical protein Ddc_11834 [Ditylenchus destructor]